MSLVHLHLMLNHVPVIGMIFVLVALVVAQWRRSSEMAKFGLGVLVAIAAVTAVVFLTGEPTEEAVENLAGVSEAVIHTHEEAAEAAMIATAAAGVLSVALLWIFRRRELPRWGASLALVVVLGVSALMAWTANLGGQIRHSEIRTSATPAVPPDDPHER